MDVFPLRIIESDQHRDKVDHGEDTRESEYGEGLAVPSVCFPAEVPVHGDLIGEPAPEDDPGKDGK